MQAAMRPAVTDAKCPVSSPSDRLDRSGRGAGENNRSTDRLDRSKGRRLVILPGLKHQNSL